MNRLLLWVLCLAVSLSLLLSHISFAGPPSVRFDAPFTAAACDVTPPEFAAANPEERLVEVVVPVSSLIQHGREEDLIQYLIQFDSPQQTCRVVDYLPRTTLSTDVVGEVGIDRREEHSQSVGINLTGRFQQTVQGTASGNLNNSDSSSVRYSLLPPLELLAASGTTHRGCGVFFKLRPSPRTSLEGSKEFVLVLRVPRNWRGDYLRLRCDAVGYDRGLTRHFDQHSQFGLAELTIALYAEGDELARACAEHLATSDRQLRVVAHENSGAIREARYPSFLHHWASEIELYEPDLPDNWFQQVISTSPTDDHQRFASKLPDVVDRAIADYATAKRSVHAMSRGGSVESLEPGVLSQDSLSRGLASSVRGKRSLSAPPLTGRGVSGIMREWFQVERAERTPPARSPF